MPNGNWLLPRLTAIKHADEYRGLGARWRPGETACALAGSDRESPGNRCEQGSPTMMTVTASSGACLVWKRRSPSRHGHRLHAPHQLINCNYPCDEDESLQNQPTGRRPWDHRLPGLRKNGQKRSLKRGLIWDVLSEFSWEQEFRMILWYLPACIHSCAPGGWARPSKPWPVPWSAHWPSRVPGLAPCVARGGWR